MSFKKNYWNKLGNEEVIFPGSSGSKESACNAGNLGSIPG